MNKQKVTEEVASLAQGLEWSSSNQKVGGSIFPITHAEVSLGKRLNPKLPLLIEKSADAMNEWV